MFHLWVWEQPSWRVIAIYPTREEAEQAGKDSCGPPDNWTVTADGSDQDRRMREHCTERDANAIKFRW